VVSLQHVLRVLVKEYCRWFPFSKGKRKIISITLDWMGQYSTVVSVSSGARFHVDISDHIQRTLYFFGIYEPAVTTLIQSLLHPGDTFLDVGAHVGYYTILAGLRVGPCGHVHSFEPMPHIFRLLAQNVTLNQLSNVTFNELAVSDKDNMLRMYLPGSHNSGIGSMVHRPGSSGETIDCLAQRLDTYWEHHGTGPVTLIKLDIEGGEFFALQGMPRLLSHRPAPDLICEASPSLAERCGYCMEEMLDFVRSFGYRTYEITPHGLVELERSDFRDDKNLYFTRKQQRPTFSLAADTMRRIG
jgi:FkbM family methyltransferase